MGVSVHRTSFPTFPAPPEAWGLPRPSIFQRRKCRISSLAAQFSPYANPPESPGLAAAQLRCRVNSASTSSLTASSLENSMKPQKTTALVLESGSDSGGKTDGVSYSSFMKNPIIAGNDAFSVYYYISLRKITVGGKTVKIPYEYLSPDGGGAIVDSGSTFTYMSRSVFEPVMSEFVTQLKKYKRASDVEIDTGIGPCFDVSGGGKLELPELKLHFKGGAELVPPPENYFVFAGKTGAVCLAVVTDDGFGAAASSVGPSIILGNFQMQNFYVEYDLKNERFGFRKQTCK
ncbi:eukaryotic aspartyl protease family protein [Actinidia rufa]|uniref:Eukaryotic aspartyl protease family protein n=1 Tax=Actinidia rufa TaxID=165716 RepID=A0A7J0HAW9_9ERIC|nr:eukaryotic aspartyl protease family protein [Actinidia rufa]